MQKYPGCRGRIISLTCCVVVEVESALVSGTVASSSNRPTCCCLWSGDGVSRGGGRLGGGPGLCTTRRVKSKPHSTHARMQKQWGRQRQISTQNDGKLSFSLLSAFKVRDLKTSRTSTETYWGLSSCSLILCWSLSVVSVFGFFGCFLNETVVVKSPFYPYI